VRVDRSKLPVLGQDPSIRFPAIAKHVRPDGLRVWTVEHRDVPVFCVSVLFPVGSAADPPARHGLAALTADLLDEGTSELDALALHDALARIGSQLDTEVGVDASTVSIVTLSKFAARALDLLAGVVLRPRFDEADFVRVRDNRVSRLVQLRDVPGAVAERLFAWRLYGSHPYGHTALGSEAAVRVMTADEVRAFHRDVLVASGPTVLAVGDVSHEEVVALVDRAWPVSPVSRPAAKAAPGGAARPAALSGSRIALVNRPGAAQSELRIGRVAAARSTPDYAALAVLNTALGGAFVSRINLKLREEKGFTYGARSSFDYRREPGPFAVQASVQTNATAEAVADVLAEIAAIGAERPITPVELARAHAALTRSYPRNFETADQIARAVAQLVLHGLPDDYFDRFVADVRRVTDADVLDVATRYLLAHDLQLVIVGDRERVGDLAALGLGTPDELPASFDPSSRVAAA
jgi:zinc protease